MNDAKMNNYINRWTLTALACLGLCALVVLPPSWAYLASRLSGIAGPDRINPPRPYGAGGFERLAASPEHPVFSVDQVAVDSVTDGSARVAFALRAYGGTPAYPSLTVTLLDATGQVRRSVSLAPSAYEHGTTPGSETAHLVVALQPGESRITIVPANVAVLAWLPDRGARP